MILESCSKLGWNRFKALESDERTEKSILRAYSPKSSESPNEEIASGAESCFDVTTITNKLMKSLKKSSSNSYNGSYFWTWM